MRWTGNIKDSVFCMFCFVGRIVLFNCFDSIIKLNLPCLQIIWMKTTVMLLQLWRVQECVPIWRVNAVTVVAVIVLTYVWCLWRAFLVIPTLGVSLAFNCFALYLSFCLISCFYCFSFISFWISFILCLIPVFSVLCIYQQLIA